MLWLIDTNVISELWKPRPDEGVVRWLEEEREECVLSEIVFAELYYGLHRLPYGKRRTELERKIQFLREDYEDAILPFGPAEAYSWGDYAAEVFADRGRDYFTASKMRDSALASTARAWLLTVVTRNTRDFPFVPTFDPFQA